MKPRDILKALRTPLRGESVWLDRFTFFHLEDKIFTLLIIKVLGVIIRGYIELFRKSGHLDFLGPRAHVFSLKA